MICFAGNSNSSIVLTLILSVVTPNLSLNSYARVSIVRLNEPVVVVAALEWILRRVTGFLLGEHKVPPPPPLPGFWSPRKAWLGQDCRKPRQRVPYRYKKQHFDTNLIWELFHFQTTSDY